MRRTKSPFYFYLLSSKTEKPIYPRMTPEYQNHYGTSPNHIINIFKKDYKYLDDHKKLIDAILFSALFYDHEIQYMKKHYNENISWNLVTNTYSKDEFFHNIVKNLDDGYVPPGKKIQLNRKNIYSFYLLMNFFLFCRNYITDEYILSKFEENIKKYNVSKYFVNADNTVKKVHEVPVEEYLDLIKEYNLKYQINSSEVIYGEFFNMDRYISFCERMNIDPQEENSCTTFFKHMPYYSLKLSFLLENNRNENLNKLLFLHVFYNNSPQILDSLKNTFMIMKKNEKRFHINLSNMFGNDVHVLFFNNNNDIDYLFDILNNDLKNLKKSSISKALDDNSNQRQYNSQYNFWYAFSSLDHILDLNRMLC